jgi:hypothetical protein
MVTIAQTDYLETAGAFSGVLDRRYSSDVSNIQDNYFINSEPKKTVLKEIDIKDINASEVVDVKTAVILLSFSLAWSAIPALLNLVFPKFLGTAGYIFSVGLLITFIVKSITSK